MHARAITGCTAVLLSLAVFIGTAPAQERGIVNNATSPHAVMRSVNLGDVRWTDGFWADRFTVVRESTIPALWEYFGEPRMHHWKNFRKAAGLEEGGHVGTGWNDGDFYKWMEAVSHVYHVTQDPTLDRWLDEIIPVIAKAQQPDGYIHTHNQLKGIPPFYSLRHHELYDMGHLMTAACMHYRATGKTTFLAIATKNADMLCRTFLRDDPRLWPFGFNPSQIMGCVELYRTTGERRYLDLAMRFIENRGKTEPGTTISMEESAKHNHEGGTDVIQDRTPLREETEAVGHAVTATYLYTGAADAVMETGDIDLKAALDRIRGDIVRRKMYLHGGTAPLHRGMSIHHDDVHEAFSDAYHLPNRTGYNETCANIGLAMFNWRLLLMSGDAQYMDLVERVFYNGGISGLSLDGKQFLYTNVLRRYGEDVPLLNQDRRYRMTTQPSYCCPPQLARTIAKMHGYTYTTGDDAVWVHLYGANVLDTRLAKGQTVKLRQETRYPWEGDIRLTIEAAPSIPLSVKLRIPGWADGARITVNGRPVRTGTEPGSYAEVRRVWRSGDVLNLHLPMEVRMIRANPLVEETRNQVAVMRGPLVYCLESKDQPEGVDVMDVIVPHDIRWTPRYMPDLLMGVTVLDARAKALRDPEWSGAPYNDPHLYKALDNPDLRPVDIRLIPYCTWSNRGPSRMTVWMPVDW